MSAALVLAVLGAGALGALARFGVSRAVAARATGSAGREPFPWAVLVVNAVGSAIGGAVLAWPGVGDDVRLVILTGLCGGLTTFSTFSVETVQLVLEGRSRAAVASVAANLVLGIGAAAAAFAIVAALA